MWKLATLAAAVLLGAGTAVAGPQADGAGYLGVRLQRVDGGLAEALDIAPDSGVLVGQVVQGSPAEAAGLKPGDIVVAIDGDKVGTPDELRDVIRGHKAGQEVSIGVRRDGRKHTLKATLVEPETSDRPMNQRVRRHVRDAREMRSGGERGWLGVHTQPLTGDLGEYFGAKDGGALVSEVVEDSPAAKLGLEAGDVIVGVDGTDIRDPADLRRVIREHEEPVDVEVTWLRGKAEQHGTTRLEVREGTAPFEGLGLSDASRPHGFRWMPGDEGAPMRDRVYAFRMRAADETQKALDELREQVKKLSEQVRKLERRID